MVLKRQDHGSTLRVVAGRMGDGLICGSSEGV